MQRLFFTHKDLVPFVELPMNNSRESEKLAGLTYAILLRREAEERRTGVYDLHPGPALPWASDIHATPCYGVGVYSEATLNREGWSCNLAWRPFVWEALSYVEPKTVWVLDQVFSFARWLKDMEDWKLPKGAKRSTKECVTRLRTRWARRRA